MLQMAIMLVEELIPDITTLRHQGNLQQHHKTIRKPCVKHEQIKDHEELVHVPGPSETVSRDLSPGASQRRAPRVVIGMVSDVIKPWEPPRVFSQVCPVYLLIA